MSVSLDLGVTNWKEPRKLVLTYIAKINLEILKMYTPTHQTILFSLIMHKDKRRFSKFLPIKFATNLTASINKLRWSFFAILLTEPNQSSQLSFSLEQLHFVWAYT